jgi:hypothetical protein
VRYRINSPQIVHQIFDAEVVIVNLETGNYYSLRGSGVELWRRVTDGASFPSPDTTPPVDHQAEVTSFLEQLEREKLIVPDNTAEKPFLKSAVWSSADWLPPTIEKFTDMRDMLLTDPIHELDEGGWPKPAPPGNA